MTLTVDTLTTWMSKFAEKVETNKQFLSDLDTPIGDGDHGFNMDRGMKAVEEKLATKPADVTSGFKIIAMALISEPQILFLDEPTLGLDVLARSDLWDIIRSLKGRITIILTTHYMEEAESLSDHIAIMKNGKLLFAGTADEIKIKAGTDRFEDAFVKLVKEGVQ